MLVIFFSNVKPQPSQALGLQVNVMDCHYVCIEMKWLSLFILPQVDYARVDVITTGLLWQSGALPLLCMYVAACVCAYVRLPG